MHITFFAGLAEVTRRIFNTNG